ncbi:two-component system sensor histidine kinase NtrB [Nitrincola schmidtii]|uniref:two-component system sensor histidine kinase NtrB n=1 Tax=Nitrincola schmidtii TaxID=1730894 RepID=UPI00124F170B|nr:ATP-binding protein [Nitrincola schmidtii]
MDVTIKAWRIMRLLTLYRIVLAMLIVFLIHTGYLPDPLGETYPHLFNTSVFLYAIISLLAIYPLLLRTPHYTWQVYTHTTIDIVLFTLMMHASGGISSGVGMLLVVSIANASMLLAGRMSVFFAAVASIAVLFEQFYSQVYSHTSQYNYSMAGLLGLALIVTSVLATVLAKQARENADLAHARGLDLANMSELTEQVISQMATGVLVVDQQQSVRLVNEAARRLLDAPSQSLGTPLQYFSTELNLQLRLWMKERKSIYAKQRVDTLPASLLIQIVPISSGGDERKAGVLIFLEDAALVDEQSQQLRLASLGRLTAGIAHEIRNPLSSIGHASALLAESDHLPPEDLRLTDIIKENTARVNRIVEDVLQLGNRDRVSKEKLEISSWLQRFIDELVYLKPEIKPLVIFDNKVEQPIHVIFDSGHLHQILSNLFRNACDYALLSEQTPEVIVRLSGGDSRSTFIEVINNGPPVKEQHRDQLFEPFFTTTAKGTGLGLYLSRELAQANQSHLAHQQQKNYTCFRLSFNAQVIIEED